MKKYTPPFVFAVLFLVNIFGMAYLLDAMNLARTWLGFPVFMTGSLIGVGCILAFCATCNGDEPGEK